MKQIARTRTAVALLLWAFLSLAGVIALGVDNPARPALVVQLEIEGPIGPATGDYVMRSLDQAAEHNAALVILRMDTPGGLDIAMRDIIKKIIASTVPVATYVAPGGARAASAGTYILYASHVAAMAPATNIGAATPVQIVLPGGFGDDSPKGKSGEKKPDPGQAMEQKMVNDAVAYIRGLAKLRGRNADWAEKAVREAASLPAEEALSLKVIDIIARDTDDLLKQLDGRQINVLGQSVLLNLSDARVEKLEPDWRSGLLAVIANPNIAYILMLVGIYGIILELYHPGAIAPGTIGGICLLLSLYAFQALPVNYAGLALILLGIGLMVAEAFVPSFGVLGLGGISAFVFGSIMLLDTNIPGFEVSPVLIAAFALSSAAIFILVTGIILKARGKPVVSGREQLIGASGIALEDFEGYGKIRIHGEIWSAQSDAPLRKGQSVTVQHIDGLTLVVTPFAKGG